MEPDCISPDVKNSIHVGDRILEINGTPIHNVPLDEVLKIRLHCVTIMTSAVMDVVVVSHNTINKACIQSTIQYDIGRGVMLI